MIELILAKGVAPRPADAGQARRPTGLMVRQQLDQRRSIALGEKLKAGAVRERQADASAKIRSQEREKLAGGQLQNVEAVEDQLVAGLEFGKQLPKRALALGRRSLFLENKLARSAFDVPALHFAWRQTLRLAHESKAHRLRYPLSTVNVFAGASRIPIVRFTSLFCDDCAKLQKTYKNSSSNGNVMEIL